jgi:AraC-like DNA-binding protein
MDPLDDIFSAMRVRSAIYARLECTGPWGLSLAGGQSARFGLVVKGSCQLVAEGLPEPVPLAAGDCYVLARGTPYVLCDNPRTPTVSCASAVRDYIDGVVHLGSAEGIAATVVCGWFTFDERSARPLMNLLPPLLHVRMEQTRAHALQGTLQLLAMETATPGLGSQLVVSRLADILFIQAIRAYVEAGADAKAGWLSALGDPRIGPALHAIHADVAHGWTVESLASLAALSRSAFALRFKEKVGEAPLAYLTRWRMFKAGHLLRQRDQSLASVAGAVGYESEPAFSKAFKRNTGVTPGSYRRQQACADA